MTLKMNELSDNALRFVKRVLPIFVYNFTEFTQFSETSVYS